MDNNSLYALKLQYEDQYDQDDVIKILKIELIKNGMTEPDISNRLKNFYDNYNIQMELDIIKNVKLPSMPPLSTISTMPIINPNFYTLMAMHNLSYDDLNKMMNVIQNPDCIRSIHRTEDGMFAAHINTSNNINYLNTTDYSTISNNIKLVMEHCNNILDNENENETNNNETNNNETNNNETNNNEPINNETNNNEAINREAIRNAIDRFARELSNSNENDDEYEEYDDGEHYFYERTIPLHHISGMFEQIFHNNNPIFNMNNPIPIFNINNPIFTGPPPNEDVLIVLNDEDYKNLKKSILDEKIEDKCVICFDCMDINQEIIELQCCHKYHSNCITEHLTKYSNKCPNCKQEAGRPKYLI